MPVTIASTDDVHPFPAAPPKAPLRPPAWPGLPDVFQPGESGCFPPAALAALPPDEGLMAATRPRSSASTSGPPAGPQEAKARAEQLRQSDALKAQEIHAAMLAEREVSQAKILALLADAQTQWLQVWEEVMLARQKVVDDAVDKWCHLLVG